MRAIVVLLDGLTDVVGRIISWLLVLMMLITCLVVVLRYLFHAGNIIFLQESVSYLHAATFLLAAGWTLRRGGHVRVDIFYRRFKPKTRAWIDALGTLLLLLPFSVFLFWTSLEYVGRAWSIQEASSDAGGIPFVYILKTLIPAFCVLLIVQGVAELIRNGLLICTDDTKLIDQPESETRVLG